MKAFHIIYLDDDTKTFSMSLPMVDDTKVSKVTSELQEKGRNVRICTVEIGSDSSEIEKYYNNMGYVYDVKTNW